MGIKIAIGREKIGHGSGESGLAYCTPQLQLSEDVVLDEFDATTGWSSQLGTGTIELNEVQKKSSTGSVKMTTPAAGTNMTIIKQFSLGLTSELHLKLWMYLHSEVNTFSQVILFARQDADSNFSMEFTPSDGIIFKDTWVRLTKPVWQVTGTPSWANIESLRIRIVKPDGSTCIASFDLMVSASDIKPACLITFDNGIDSVFTKAYPILKAKKMIATAYIQADKINVNGHMTPTQLQELNANKWDLGNHTITHADLTTLTQQQCEDELNGCKDALNALGLTRASLHVAYPQGTENATVLAAMTAFGAKTGRKIGNQGSTFDAYWPYQIRAYYIQTVNTVAEVKGWIDTALANNFTPILLFHNIVDANPAPVYQWTTADFTEIINYIETLGLQTLTIDEYYRLYSGAITVHHK